MKEGVQAIIQQINLDAEKHSNERYVEIKNKVDEEIKNENVYYRNELDKRCEMLKKHNDLEYLRLRERLSSRLNRELLTYQRDLLDEIFDMAAIKLQNASINEFSDMFSEAIKGLKGNFILYLGELSKGKLNNQIIKQVSAKNKDLRISLSSVLIPHKSGFVLSDDRVEYNCLFEDLIEDKKNEQAAAVLKEVFLEGNGSQVH